MSLSDEQRLNEALSAIEQHSDEMAKQKLQALMQDATGGVKILAKSYLATIIAREDLEDEALDMARSAIGEAQSLGDDQVLMQSYNNLASMLVHFGFELDEPIELWERVLGLVRQHHGATSMEAASVLQDLGVAYRYTEQIELAIARTKEALAAYEANIPAWQLPCVLQRLHLVQCHDRAHQFEQSAQVLEGLFALFDEAPFHEEGWLLMSVPTIAGALGEQGRSEEADRVYGYMLESLERLNVSDPDLLATIQKAREDNRAFARQVAEVESQWAEEERASIAKYGEEE